MILVKTTLLELFIFSNNVTLLIQHDRENVKFNIKFSTLLFFDSFKLYRFPEHKFMRKTNVCPFRSNLR